MNNHILNFFRSLRNLAWKCDTVFFKIIAGLQGVTIGEGLDIKGRIFIRSKGKCSIGKSVKIVSCLEANPIGGQERSIIIVGQNAKLKIGDRTRISNSAIYSKKQIDIGSDVFIGGSCKIYDSDFHSLNLNNRLQEVDPDIRMRPIVIDDGVFVGAHTIILKGTCIGKESVIGAGSVVAGVIPPYQVWAGNPAKYIKTLQT